MACPRSNLILRLLSGELAGEQRREFEQHVAVCEACAAELQALQASWSALGDWRLEPPEVGLGASVQARAQQESQLVADDPAVVFRWAVAFRAAASILIAVGLGISAGFLVVPENAVPPTAAVSDEQVIESLGLADLAIESATGLPIGLERPEPAEGGQES